jgi:predicted molibdopterin-dependent oxidoreductase YjgC
LSKDWISITINGRPVQVPKGISVSAAVMMAGEISRLSVKGEARAPLCGMGICMECRLTVNGVTQVRSCQVTCTSGMEVATG